MAIQQGVLVLVAHETAADPRVLVQANPETGVTSSASITWTAGSAQLKDATGADAASVTTLGGLHQSVFGGNPVFEVTNDSDVAGGSGSSGKIKLNHDGLAALGNLTPAEDPFGVYTALINAFLTGGAILLSIDGNDCRVQLRALRTADFIFDGNLLRPAHHPGATSTASNMTHGSGESDADFVVELASDPAALVSYNITGTGSANALTLDATLHAPYDESQNDYQLTLGRLFTTLSDTPPTPSSYTTYCTVSARVYVPTELVVLLDRSGSMGAIVSGTESKWTIASDVGNLFAQLYGKLIPDRTASSGTVASQYKIKFGTFHSSGGTDTSFDAAYKTAEEAPPTAPAVSPAGGTPAGEGLVDSVAEFTSGPGGEWRRRQILILTDGMDNAGSPQIEDLVGAGGSVASLPSLTHGASPDKSTGVIVHNISYALTGDTPHADLDDLVTDHDGIYDNTATAVDPMSPQTLRSAFLSRLSNVVPAEMAAITSTVSVAEDGLDKLVIVSDLSDGATDLTVTDSGATSVGTDAGHDAAFAWITIPNPIPNETYTVGSAVSGANLHAFYDLAVRSRFGVEASRVGEPIKIWAEVKKYGVPVSGADVRVALSSPAESTGEVLSKFSRKGGLVKAYNRRTLSYAMVQAALLKQATIPATAVLNRLPTVRSTSPALVGAAAALSTQPVTTVAATVAAAGASISATTAASGAPIDVRALRAQLLRAAAKQRNLDIQYNRTSLDLTEVAPGRYEAIVPAENAEHDGAYTVEYRIDGHDGKAPFARDYRRSFVLKAAPEPESSDTALVNIAPANTPSKWTATVIPKTKAGIPLGPGLGSRAQFHYLDPKDRKNPDLPKLTTVDNLDGSYSTTVSLPEDKLPKFALFYGNPDQNGTAIVAKKRAGKLRRVKVILNKILVTDDHDAGRRGPGELVFHAHVSPNASPSRTVQTRLPNKKYYSVSSGESIDIGETIYDGYVEDGASLAMSITGVEMDWPSPFQKDDTMTRYVRTFPVPEASTEFTPQDEPNDPESLADWKLWYTVKVE